MEEKKKRIVVVFVILGIFLISAILLTIFNFDKIMCPSGYKYKNHRCTQTSMIAPKVSKSCSEGYQLEGDTCFRTETAVPTIDYYCNNTYKQENSIIQSASTLSGSTCSYSLSHEAVQKKSCLPGAVPYSDTKCRSTITTRAPTRIDVLTGRIIYYCVGDAVLSGTSCLLYAYSDYVYESICVEGYVLNNGRCYKYFTYDAAWHATCPGDYTFVDKNTCTKKVLSKVHYHYDCPEDYDLIDKTCQKEITIDNKLKR